MLTAACPVSGEGEGREAVSLIVGERAYPIFPSVTVNHRRTPWNVFSFDVGGRTAKCFPGRGATQTVEGGRPRFLVTTGQDARLADFAIIRLRTTRRWRRLPQSELTANTRLAVDLGTFTVRETAEGRYEIEPLEPLPPGQYVLLNMNQRPMGSELAYEGYCFSVE